MLATLLPPPPVTTTPEPVYFRLSTAKYDSAVRAGIFDENDPLELLEGLLISKMPTDPPHDVMVGVVPDVLSPRLPSGWFIRTQATLALPDGRPEPDVAIARGKRFDYLDRHPDASDVALAIEISDATLARDRGIKLRSYARAGVVEYWIVNLVDRQIEAHTQPVGETYASRVIYVATDTIALPATLGGATIAVADLLPPA